MCAAPLLRTTNKIGCTVLDEVLLTLFASYILFVLRE
jgi:hypothetical protein